MSKQRATKDEEPAGADAESAPEPSAVETLVDPEVVDAEVVEDVEVIEDAEVVEESCVGTEAEAEDPASEPDPLADALRERAEYLELAQRARADFDNYRRRVAGQTTEAERRGRATLARGLLPAVDNLGRALAAAGVDPASPESAEEGLARGVALVLGELRSGLERAGVIAFDPAGERFDPTLHEAISTAPAPDGGASGTVLETLELGYRVDEQVIRPARVVVSG